ncbi:hypothetical protein [Streptomyces sp. NPDC101150]|uniref:hypothetical protein n=1 Tax=Streptomyces sp. NPDC101150 TaxID=3366114 RepID=UPI003830E900
MRTDLVAGCTGDRGLQVFNTAYPQVRRRLPLARLRLRSLRARLPDLRMILCEATEAKCQHLSNTSSAMT